MNRATTGFSYRLVFQGEVLPGFEAQRTKQAFAKAFPVSTSQLNQVFAGGPVVLRQCVSRETGLQVLNRLAALGMACELQLVDSSADRQPAPELPVPQPRHPSPASQANVAQVPVKRSRVYSQQQITSWFPSEPVKVKPRFGVRFGTRLIALAMLAVLAVYAFICSLAAAATVWHAASALAPLSAQFGRSPGALIYTILLLSGSAVVLLLLKAFIAARPHSSSAVELDPRRQRAVFEFISELCRCLRAPKPVEVKVDTGLKVETSRRRGILHPELTLTLGMPLVLGLNVQALAGLLAREFARWSKAPAMRAGALIEDLNRWAWQRLNEDDAWDLRVRAMQQSHRTTFAAAGRVLAWGVSAVRGLLLRPLTQLNRRISAGAMKRMALHADEFAIRLCGSKRFERSVRRLRELAAGGALAEELYESGWSQGHLVDNMPALIVQLAQHRDLDTGERLAAPADHQWCDPWQVRPTDDERLAAARTFNAAAQLQQTGRASRLFYSLDVLCRKATFALYRSRGVRFSDKHLVPLHEFAATADAINEQRESLERLFGNAFSSDRVLLIPNVNRMRTADPASIDDAQRRARAQWRSVAQEATAVIHRREELLHNLRNLRIARALIHGDVSIDAGEFNLESAEPHAVNEQVAATIAELQSMERALAEFEKIQALVLASTLAYGCARNLCRPAELTLALNALNMLRQHAASIVELEAMSHELQTLAALAGHARTRAVETAIGNSTAKLERMLATLFVSLRHIQNPLNIDCTLAQELDEWAGDRKNLSADATVAAHVATSVARCMRHLNSGITAQIADLTERIVAASGEQVAIG